MLKVKIPNLKIQIPKFSNHQLNVIDFVWSPEFKIWNLMFIYSSVEVVASV
ncbi:hypothetical protein FLJC2902T_09700 [Flavobacterium limnosediminis JC2902]|uniref:Uncharacterized protein n=1 Tax=Flavobacterium limnosediminis JC2902 TaxID=1341181 RepID=V6SQG5_9FLAO|nr:hypothetical protein FLJC2902T_09700 [Flavobacterium limnosediminis JC2902]